MQSDHKPLPLLDRTYLLLAERTETLEEVAIGARVNEWWLRKFAQRTGQDHGVNRVQRLHDYLAARASATQVSAS